MTRVDVLREAADAAPASDVKNALRRLRDGAHGEPTINPWLHPAAQSPPSQGVGGRFDGGGGSTGVGVSSQGLGGQTGVGGQAAPGEIPSRGAGPTAAHLREVTSAIEKFCGLGRYERTGARLLVPAFTIRWDDARLPPDLGAIGFYPDGSAVIWLRSDVTPVQCHCTMLHELQHAHDHAFNGLRKEHGQHPVFEARACAAAARLAWL